VPGLSYALEASTNMIQWEGISTNVAPFVFMDVEVTNFTQRFYRAVYRP